jgi:CRP-like cAMP-binding protein
LFHNKVKEGILAQLDESLLSEIPPFRRLANSEIREVLDEASSRRFESGTEIFAEGEPSERFYLLLDGHVRVVKSNEMGEQIIALYIAAGQLFGIAPALGRESYPATAIAADECLALSWPTSLWSTFVTRYDGFASETYKVVGARVEEMQKRVLEIATQQVEQRVANALLRLVRQMGKKVEDGVEIDFPITRQHISEMTGTTLHTVSRLLSTWEKEGIVRSQRKKIVITKPHALVILGQTAT